MSFFPPFFTVVHNSYAHIHSLVPMIFAFIYYLFDYFVYIIVLLFIVIPIKESYPYFYKTRKKLLYINVCVHNVLLDRIVIHTLFRNCGQLYFKNILLLKLILESYPQKTELHTKLSTKQKRVHRFYSMRSMIFLYSLIAFLRMLSY